MMMMMMMIDVCGDVIFRFSRIVYAYRILRRRERERERER